ncbi:MAG: ABC transporter permease, partial [Alphaproteobacteria bacterium]|nr:ABC transporter permease [Alphaproteobacteria bacterium]
MYSYIIRRLAFGALTVIGVSIIVFVVLRILPGDPLVAIFGAEGFTKLSEAERARYMADLGLSDPLALQYLRWVGDIVRGNFGRSFFRAESVGEMIMRRGPLTAEIAMLSVILSWLVGVPVAIVSALRPNSFGDNVSRFLSILFLAVPGFWLGMLIVLVALFAFGYRAPLTAPRLLSDPWGNLQVVIGPAVVLGLGQAAYIARMARSSLLEVIREDYVRTARAKGLSERQILVRHILRNSLIPILSLWGLDVAQVIGGGAILTESVFNLHGVGQFAADAIGRLDVPPILVVTMLTAFAVVLLGAVVD